MSSVHAKDLPEVIETLEELEAWKNRGGHETIALVPTMGALHAGHLALVERARQCADRVMVSIFVNPLQFGAGEDFARYPRTPERDREALAGRADAVFVPRPEVVYPEENPVPRFAAGPVGDTYEGRVRPGHFDGMLTVVARLITLVAPHVVVFGQKDAQQVFLVRRMLAESFPDVRLEVVPTVREHDGLALSSRNRYLSDAERAHAVVLHRALSLATLEPQESVSSMRALIHAEKGVEVDYVDAVDPTTFHSVLTTSPSTPGLVTRSLTYIVAARVGSTRLLDTVDVNPHN